jgi:hypothetical protein
MSTRDEDGLVMEVDAVLVMAYDVLMMVPRRQRRAAYPLAFYSVS